MKELTSIQIQQVNGGVIIQAFLAGVALGVVAKKLYKKYQASQAAATSADVCKS